jgi:hemolysin III
MLPVLYPLPASRSPPRSSVGGVVGAAMESLDAIKPLLRGWLHAGMAPAALVAGIVLVALAPGDEARVAAVVYALTAVLLFGVSAVYHRGTWGPRATAVLRRLDHANIYLLIAGSYTPFAVLALRGDTRVAVLVCVWVGALAGVTFRVSWVSAPPWLFTPFYVLLGWVAAFVIPQLVRGAGVPAFVLVVVGGGLYTLGGLVYALRRPNPLPRWFGFHEVFHTLTVVAFVTQYVAVSLLMYRVA